ncbi:hypothetical protein [Pseudosulfitobacter sp. SM2401]|uniref:hypothetical protein n=1 Tax=Pseudosulfitobacter sp. SM2401 TaxID=3350098 RepID=UPI0036F1EE3A
MLKELGSVRHSLAQATSAVHQELHSHPWISRLASRDLQLETYAGVIGAYRAFFAEIETKRHGLKVFHDLSLLPQITAMKHDLVKIGHEPRCFDLAGKALVDNNPMAILGALYTLHGAGFGAKTLNANVKRTLPHAPRNYLALGTSPDVWRRLTLHLADSQSETSNERKLFQGASQTFVQFGKAVTEFCEDA